MGIFDFYNKKEEPQEMKKKGQIIVKGVELEGFETFQGSGMLADDVLIDEGYASNTDVYAIISRICEVSSDIPFVVESFNGEIWEEDEDY